MTEGELSFESAPELFQALANPNAIERKPVLAWVATHPAEAIALGAVDGRDVVDVLIGLIDKRRSYGYWQDLAITVGAFDAPKVTAFFLAMLAEASEAVEAEDAANALGRRQRTGMRDRLVEILLSDDVDRAAATARLLVEEEQLPEAAAVRVATIEDEREPPTLDSAAADAWTSELSGPFGGSARDRLRDQGAEAVRALAERWDRLEDEDRIWLLEWSAEATPAEAGGLVDRALESGSDPVALAALRTAAGLPDGSVDAGRLGRWAQREDPEIRAAAIAAGAAADPEFLLAGADTDPDLVVAAIRRLAERDDAGAIERIAAYLGADSIEVRAAAREAIVALGPDAIEPLRPLVHSENPETRAGAVRGLLDLGDDEWLSRELLD